MGTDKKLIGKRIADLLAAKNGGNQSELAKKVDVSPQAVQQWIAGITSPRGENLQKTAIFLDTTPEYILFGINPGFQQAKQTENYEIRQYDTGGGMGNGLILKEQPGVIENFRVNANWLRENLKGYSSTKNLCIVTGFGESMKPLFNPGDPVIVDLSIKEFIGDFPYFFRIGDEGYIKRLQKIPGQGLIALSANREYRDWPIQQDMDFEILGRVLKVWKSEDF